MDYKTRMIKKYCICLLLFVLWGCAPTREFQTERQAGAQQEKEFPRFSDRPEAETSQFTPDESQNLDRELASKAQNLRKQSNKPPSSTSNTAERTKILRQEVEQTLRQIEQGEN